MKLLALVKSPADPGAAATSFAEATGLTLAEARMRLAPEPPALLARLSSEAAESARARLASSGIRVLALDEVPQPRFVGRAIQFHSNTLRIGSRTGETIELAPAEITSILRVSHAARSSIEETTVSREFSLGNALLTQGLKTTRTVEKTTRSRSEDREQSLLVYSRTGCVALRETVVDFSCLGAAMQPVRVANMTALASKLRELIPNAFFDDRLVRLGGRPLPFVMSESQVNSPGVSSTRTSTALGVELLADALNRAHVDGLLR